MRYTSGGKLSTLYCPYNTVIGLGGGDMCGPRWLCGMRVQGSSLIHRLSNDPYDVTKTAHILPK